MKVLDRWKVMQHGPLSEVADGVLTVEGELRMPLGKFPRRMTVVRLSGQRTAIWSAIALDEPEMKMIEAVGEPAFIIVPNPYHRLDVKAYKRRYPNAAILAPAGAAYRVSELVHTNATGNVLDDRAVNLRLVPGCGQREFAMTVKRAAETTLILNDLVGHISHPHSLGLRVMSRLLGFGPAPHIPGAIKRRIIDNPQMVAKQFRDWADIPSLRRIIVSHGDLIDDAPSDTLRELAETLADANSSR